MQRAGGDRGRGGLDLLLSYNSCSCRWAAIPVQKTSSDMARSSDPGRLYHTGTVLGKKDLAWDSVLEYGRW